jgi:hypothetical protein
MPSNRTITESFVLFSTNKNFLFLFGMILTIINQKRVLETLYGGYCLLFHKPSLIVEKAGFETHQFIPLIQRYNQLKKKKLKLLKKKSII